MHARLQPTLLACLAMVAMAACAQLVATSGGFCKLNPMDSSCQTPLAGTATGDDSNIILRYVGYVLETVLMGLMSILFLAGFLIVDIGVPVAITLGSLLAKATTSVKAAIALALASCVFGLYYFRYYYSAPKKSTKDLKSDLSGPDHSDAGFDLHPDVTLGDETDGASYTASLESRSGRGRYYHDDGSSIFGLGDSPGPAVGAGFPADFLKMFMKSISIFGYIEEPVFHEFSRQLQTRRLLAGERMFENDEDRDDQDFYVVIEGQVQIYLVDDAGKRPATPSEHMDMSSASSNFPDSFDGHSAGYGDGVGFDDEEIDTWDASDSDYSAASDAQSSDAILLNVVGPGDVLSSLFSILSLFTEGVPLSHGQQTDAARGTKNTNSHQQHHHGVDTEHTRASQQTPPPLISASTAAFESTANHLRMHAHALRPNITARATTDTTLAMIPASAFQRVTRLYPKAAAHILQVILTRLQRVTFATLYDYLNVPDELTAVERSVNALAKSPFNADLQASTAVLQNVKDIFAQHAADQASRITSQSPVLGGSASSPLRNAKPAAVPSLAASYPRQFGSTRSLQASWKITHQQLLALSRQSPHKRHLSASKYQPLDAPPDMAPIIDSESVEDSLKKEHVPMTRKNSHQGHRRADSDIVSTNSVPASDDIEALRKAVLNQLCTSIGLNAYTVDGRYSSLPSDKTQKPSLSPSATAAPGSLGFGASASRRSSTNRKLPRTEHLLPLLQNMSLPSQKGPSTSSPPLALADIPSLVNELELYHLPDNYTLIEQGQRPDGLYIILDGKVEVTPRTPMTDFNDTAKQTRAFGEGSSGGKRLSISKMTQLMTKLARRGNSKIEQDEKRHRRASSTPFKEASPLGGDIQSHATRQSLRGHRCHQAGSSSSLKPYMIHAGELVGYLSALTDMAALYTARSRGSVVVGFISRWALDRICERYPIALMTLARRLTNQLPPAILNLDCALEWVQVKANQMVYRCGESSDAVYVVLTGRLRAFIEKDNGSVSILAEYGQGQSVGEPNLLLNEPCKFNLHAIRDTELVRIPTALFKALMQTAPRLTFHLSRTLAVKAAQSLHQQQLVEQQLSRHGAEDNPWLKNGGGMASVESGIRSHNKNLKSIAIIPVNSEVPVHAFAQQLEEALTSVAGDVALLDHTAVSRVLGRHAFSRIARLKIDGWIAELEQRCRLLLHVADGGIRSPWTRHCVSHSDFILLVGFGDGDPGVGEFERLLLALKTTARKELVLLHENRSCTTGSTREWLKRRPWVHAHHHLQMPLDYQEYGLDVEVESQQVGSIIDNARTLIARSILRSSRRVLPISKIKTSIQKYYNRLGSSKKFATTSYQGHRSDFARLARYLCGRSVGVVLSGGGARGIALLGVLRAFEEAGIPVDMVGGTSIGAFVSGLYAQHTDSLAIHGPAKAFSRRMSSMWRFILDVTFPILSYTSGKEMNRTIWKVFKEAEIEDLWLPFYCLTANITQSRSEVHMSGLLWRNVRASMSLSGFVPPICNEDGDLLVDGGYLDNLPVRVMKNELGADMIFAVDIAGENDTSPVRYGEAVSGLWILLNHLNPLRSYWIPTLSEVQSRLTYSSSDKELESAKVADSCVYLRIPPRDVGVLDFGRFDELYKRGYAYAKEWTGRWLHANLLDQWQTPPATDTSQTANLDSIVPAMHNLGRRNSI